MTGIVRNADVPLCLERLRSARSLAFCVDKETSQSASKPVLSSPAHLATPATFPDLQLLVRAAAPGPVPSLCHVS